jgi:hypothetical protein
MLQAFLRVKDSAIEQALREILIARVTCRAGQNASSLADAQQLLAKAHDHAQAAVELLKVLRQ